MKTIISNVQTIIKKSPNLVFNYPDSYFVPGEVMWNGTTPAIMKADWSEQLKNKTIIGVKVIPLQQSAKIYLGYTDNAVVGTQKGTINWLSYFETKEEDLGKTAIYYLHEPISFSQGYMVVTNPSTSNNLYISRRSLRPQEMSENNIVGCNKQDIIVENNYALTIDFILADE